MNPTKAIRQVVLDRQTIAYMNYTSQMQMPKTMEEKYKSKDPNNGYKP